MDEPVPMPPAAPLRSRLVRLLHGTGVASIWAVGSLVSLVGLAIVAAVWLSRQPEGNRLTFELANRALAQNTNLRLSARRSLIVDHGAALLDARVDIVDSLGVRHPWLTARRARVLSSWWGLVTRRPGELDLELVDPVVTLEKGPDGHWLLPRTMGPERQGHGAPIGIDFELTGGMLRTHDAAYDTLARDVAATVRLHGEGGTWDFAIGRLATYLPGPKLAVRKADGRARLSEGALALDRFRVRTDAGWIEVRGGGQLGQQRTFDGDVEAGEWTWSELARALHQPHLDVAGGFAGRAHLHFDAAGLRMEAGAADVLWRDEPARVAFAGLWHDGRLRLDTSEVHWRGAGWHGVFDLVPASGAWRLDGRVADLELADLPRAWPMPPLDSLRATADVVLKGDKRGFVGSVSGGRFAWRGQALDSVAGTWALTGEQQAIDARARTAGGRIAARGTIGPRSVDAQLAAQGVRGEAVSARLWRALGVTPPPAGRLDAFDAHLAGPRAAPALVGKGKVSGFARDPVAVDHASFSLAGVLGPHWRVTADVAAGGASAGPAHADTATARVVLAPDRIEVPRLVAQRADSVLIAQGFATRAPGAWNVELDTLAWHAGDRLTLAAQGPVRMRVDAAGAVDLAPARLVSTAGSLTAKGHWGGDRGTNDLTLALQSLDLAALLGPVATAHEVQGVLTGTAHYLGPARAGTWDVSLAGTNLRYGVQRAQALRVEGAFEDLAWRIRGLDLDTGKGRVHVAGHIDWQASPPWGAPAERWTDALAHARRWEGTVSTDSLAMVEIAALLPQAIGWRGALTLTANLSGRPTAPAFSAQGKLAGAGWGQASLGDFDLALDYHDEMLAVNHFALVGGDSTGPAVRGYLPLRLGWGVAPADRVPDRPMELHAFAHRLDLGLAPLVLPEIAEATGLADVTMDFAGTPKHPHATGKLVVRNGVLRPANREEVLTGVQGTIALAGNELRIESFAASQGRSGRIVAKPGGLAHLEGLRIHDYALELTAANFTAFSSGEYVIEFNGDFQVRNGPDLGGPAPIPSITGQARVIDGTFLTNFGDPASQPGWVGPATQPPWVYDIQVEARNNVWWRPPDANVEGRLSDFEIIQDLDQFLLLGQVEAVRGRYYFLGNQFDVKSGVLFFDRAQPLNPTIDATLTTEVLRPGEGSGAATPSYKPETITLTINGRVQAPNIGMSSEPSGLAPGDIAYLLTAGQINQGGSTSANVTNVGLGAGKYLFRQIARNPDLAPFLSGVELGTANEVTNLDPGSQLVAGTGTTRTNRPLTTLGMSRYVTRDLLVRYSQIVGGVDADVQRVDYQDLAAEYRLSRLLFLQGRVTRRRGSAVTAQDQTLYNLDVRARYEY